jgi:hypothetical protein
VSPMEFVQLDLVAEASEQSSAMRMATGAVSPARHPSNGLANSRRPRPSPMEWGASVQRARVMPEKGLSVH